MGHRTPLYGAHLAAGATMVDFGGWEMPLHYGSQVAEHHAVRTGAGMFDVSHMRAVDLAGPDAEALLRRVLANDVAKLRVGRAMYSCMCNERGGVVDDVIAYRTGPDAYRVVLNCATTEKDLAWLAGHADGQVAVEPRPDLAILAVQGPQARDLAGQALALPTADLPRFASRTADGVFICRTGYTGEDGVELLLPADRAQEAWSPSPAPGWCPRAWGRGTRCAWRPG